MKRVRGTTLHDILLALAANEPEAVQRFTRRRLLAALASVSLALDFAHARGVIHRDVKPANIMLGDFGEVYVLDWGIARVMGEPEPEADSEAVDPGDRSHTSLGMVVGTPGYMAPEQMRGEPLDARTDVYAVGSLLFEILTLEPLHVGTGPASLIASTLEPGSTSAAARATSADVPPELYALCQRATAIDPADRPESARALADAIERYLDGDRDLVLRRTAADTHARSATALSFEALAGGPDELDARRRALSEVGQALVLDPSHGGARRTLLTLLTEPPRELPREANAALEAALLPALAAGGRIGALGFAGWLGFIPLFLAVGVRSWAAFAFFAATHAVAAIGLWWTSYRPRLGGPVMIATRVAMLLALASLTPFFGPLIVVPVAAAQVMMAMGLSPARGMHWGNAWFMCLVVAAPLALQAIGVLPPSYVVRDGVLEVLPGLIALPPNLTVPILCLWTIATLLVGGLFVTRVRRTLLRAERAAHLNAWQLRQLLPD